jgi:hypothetical protein
MNPEPHALYELLPVHVRVRDAEAGYPLRALIDVIGEQTDAVEADIAQLYANWFIETCADWAVPYIGDLVGYSPVAATGRASDAGTARAHLLNAAITPRAEIANILAYRRRKGTLALLEELGRSVSGWPARAVEFYALLGWTQHVRHVRPDRGRLVDLRGGDSLARLGTPFESLAHTVDVRRAGGGRRHGRFNIPAVGLFAWRLKTYSVTHAPAYCVEDEGSHCFTFSILGNDGPLFARGVPESAPTTIAQEANLPVAIRRRALEHRRSRRRLEIDANEALPDPDPAGEAKDAPPPPDEPIFPISANEALYGPGMSIAVYAPDWPRRNAPQPVPARRIVPADLTGWRHRAKRGQILLDPVTGRMVFPDRQAPKNGVWVDYRTAFSADLGGGEYHRQLAQPAPCPTGPVDKDSPAPCHVYRVSQDRPGKYVDKTINAALARWRQDRKAHPAACAAAVIEILDSAAYTEQVTIELQAGEYLQIRAADRTRPAIRLLDHMASRPDAFAVSGKAGSRLVLDGLLIVGRGLQIAGPDPHDEESYGEGDLCDVVIRHCTLVPGWGLNSDCEPSRPREPSIELIDSTAGIRIEHSILGSIHVAADEVQSDPVRIAISDSIVDSTGEQRPAVTGTNRTMAFALASFERCTVMGAVNVHAVTLAENSIFTGEVRVARRQLGCMRYCHVPPGSRTPRRSHCQPDEARRVEGVDPEFETARVRPHFTSLRYGNPAYAQLSSWCAPEIRRGADDESEMGAFHDLFQPQREANLRERLGEYSPAATDADVIFAN